MTNAKRRTIVYGANAVVPAVAGFISGAAGKIPALSKISNASNIGGALFFGSLDLLGGLSGKISGSKFTRVSKLFGTAVYGISTAIDLASLANGDYMASVNLLLDASMTYSLGKDTKDNYAGNIDLIDDLSHWRIVDWANERRLRNSGG